MSMCNAIAFVQMAKSLIFNFLLLLVLQDAIPSNIDLLFLQTMHLIAGFIHTHTHTQLCKLRCLMVFCNNKNDGSSTFEWLAMLIRFSLPEFC